MDDGPMKTRSYDPAERIPRPRAVGAGV